MSIPLPLPRVAAFEKLGFGLFVHWGLYSQLGKGEWAQNIYDIPAREYEKLQSTFTASDFDAEDLARTARDAGMKYIVLTSRHHDGFSLYDTCGLNTYDAPRSPAGRDLIAEYVEACRKYGIVPFFYHTTIDWHWEYKTTAELSQEDFSRYLDYLHESVKLLCTNYGPIGGLWFDGNWARPGDDWREDRLYGMIRKYQPEAMIINNTGLGNLGRLGHPEIDSVTYEQGSGEPLNREGHFKYVAAEVCRTMNGHWGLGGNDLNFLSPAEVIRLLARCRGCGANLLLNIGPEAQGKVPDYEKQVLLKAGVWCRLYDEAVYAPKPASGVACRQDDFMLREGSSFYYFASGLGCCGDSNVTVGRNGIGSRAVDNFREKVTSIRWLDNGEELRFVQDPGRGMLSIFCTGFPYGTDTVVRVAKIETTPRSR